MTRGDTIAKWIAYGVGLAVITIFNYYILGPLPIALPLLLPVAAVATGTLETPGFSAGFGLVAGLIMTTIGHCNLICIPVLAVIGCLCALLCQHMLRRDFVGHLLCCIVTCVLWECVQVAWLWARETSHLSLLLRVALPELLWSLILSFPVYWVCRFCCRHYGRIYHE